MKKILVTGSSGFIGSRLVRHLQTLGYMVAGLDLLPPRPDLQTAHHTCDLLDPARLVEVVRGVAPDAIVHLAARTDLGGNSSDDYPVNSSGISHLAEAIRQTPSVERCLFISSQLVCRVGYFPTRDDDYCPPNPYGESKVLTEKVVRKEDGGGVTWCLLRPTTIWGRGMNAHYASFFKHLRRGHYFHAGRKPLLKSYGFIGNTVHQIERFLSAAPEDINRRVFYLADYEPLCLQDWINAIATGLGRNPPPSVPLPLCRGLARIGDMGKAAGLERFFPYNSFRLTNILTEYQYDMLETQAVCGSLPYGFEKGVEELVDWILEQNRD